MTDKASSKVSTLRKALAFLAIYGSSVIIVAWIVYLGISWGKDYVGR